MRLGLLIPTPIVLSLSKGWWCAAKASTGSARTGEAVGSQIPTPIVLSLSKGWWPAAKASTGSARTGEAVGSQILTPIVLSLSKGWWCAAKASTGSARTGVAAGSQIPNPIVLSLSKGWWCAAKASTGSARTEVAAGSGTRATGRRRHLVVIAAGTGGHVIPGLAVAREMQSRGWTVSWLGTPTGMENRLVPPAGIPLDVIDFSGLRGKGLRHTVTGGCKLLAAFATCSAILRRRRPDAVLGMGGYACFPGGVVAAALGRPLLLVNADASWLLSNRALLPFSRRVAFGFDGEAAAATKRAVVTGNPVRADIEALPQPALRFAGRHGVLRLLVVGGSLGAKALNDCVPQALALLDAARRPKVTHQTGQVQHDAVLAAYGNAGVQAEVRPFIDDMASHLADCDLIVCRAGAITVSELCAAGVAAVLVPLVVSTTSHQRDNAAWLAGQGACIHLPQAELSPQKLADLLAGMTREGLLAIASRARALARPHAAQRVADLIEGAVAA